MLDHSAKPTHRRRDLHPPFVRIVCIVEAVPEADAAITQAIALAGTDARVLFAATWYGAGRAEAGRVARDDAQRRVEEATERARDVGVRSDWQLVHGPTPAESLARLIPRQELVVVGAHPHARATGIVLGETATQLVHRSPIPVLVARDRPLEDGVIAATRARPADRIVLTTAARIAATRGAELTVVHVTDRDEQARRPELDAELANVRALFGRAIDVYKPVGPAARSIVDAAEGDGAGLVVVGSRGRTGLPALTSVSERVAHAAPCSVLVMRDT